MTRKRKGAEAGQAAAARIKQARIIALAEKIRLEGESDDELKLRHM